MSIFNRIFLLLVSIACYYYIFNNRNYILISKNLQNEKITEESRDSIKLQEQIYLYCLLKSKEEELRTKLQSERFKNKELDHLINSLQDSLTQLSIHLLLKYINPVSDSFQLDTITSDHSLPEISPINQPDSLKKHFHREIFSFQNQKLNKLTIIESLSKDSVDLNNKCSASVKLINSYFFELKKAHIINICSVKYIVYLVNLDSSVINLHLYGNNGKNLYYIKSVDDYLKKRCNTVEMITNAGMYTPTFIPEGLYIESASAKLFDVDTVTNVPNANFYLYPNGIFYIDSTRIPHISTTPDFLKDKKIKVSNIKIATQSGPMLVINGNIHPKFTRGSINTNIRSGVGVINEKTVVFALSLDKVNFYDFASTFRDIFGCKNALYLDGVISSIYIPGLNDVFNSQKYGPILSVTKRE